MPRHGHDLTSLSEAADLAMYAVKASGKNSFAVALPGPAAAPGERHRATTELVALPVFADSMPFDVALLAR
jgi:hypothetical protein